MVLVEGEHFEICCGLRALCIVVCCWDNNILCFRGVSERVGVCE